MTMLVFGAIAVVFVLAGLGGIMYIDHLFATSVDGRSYAVKGKKVETDDPFVRKQFRKFYAIRVAYSLTLLVLLIVVVSYVE
ncbi:endonuclease [Roseibium sp. RKSG952]|uniref:endonuclease n=1 Tax=Roseibium sp. RKSG952 TaxID=2529384 RepID=UPI0012BB4A8B|nr:endonuclease [Roseibium sp. RKSG952]MTH98054.1 endonuclease [Roseibium sp. RKSG952]